jgi:hypothetical protein
LSEVFHARDTRLNRDVAGQLSVALRACGVSSGTEPRKLAANRVRLADRLGVSPKELEFFKLAY